MSSIKIYTGSDTWRNKTKKSVLLKTITFVLSLYVAPPSANLNILKIGLLLSFMQVQTIRLKVHIFCNKRKYCSVS